MARNLLWPDESAVAPVELPRKLPRKRNGRPPSGHVTRSSRREPPFLEIVKFALKAIELFIDLDSPERVEKFPVARGQHGLQG